MANSQRSQSLMIKNSNWTSHNWSVFGGWPYEILVNTLQSTPAPVAPPSALLGFRSIWWCTSEKNSPNLLNITRRQKMFSSQPIQVQCYGPANGHGFTHWIQANSHPGSSVQPPISFRFGNVFQYSVHQSVNMKMKFLAKADYLESYSAKIYESYA